MIVNTVCCMSHYWQRARDRIVRIYSKTQERDESGTRLSLTTWTAPMNLARAWLLVSGAL